MKIQIRPLLIIFIFSTVLTGIIYPLFITGIARVLFPDKANGSLVIQNDKIVGSALIGQNFTAEKYFWGRPSATLNHPYNAFDPSRLTGSAGANLGPLSQRLIQNVNEQAERLKTYAPENEGLIPIDLVSSSASGLDPDISVDSAFYQLTRVAKSRGLDEEIVKRLIEQNITPRQFGILGEPRVNVLRLNLALDGIQ